MKVLHLIDSGGLYGAEKVLLALTKQQLKRGLKPMILSAGEPGVREKPLESEALRLGLPITPWRMRPGLNLVAARQILTWAQDHKYQALHSHGYKFNILLGSWPRTLRHIPLVTTLHGYVQAQRWTKMAFYEVLDQWILPKLDAVVLVNPAMTNIPAIAKVKANRLYIIPNGLESVSNDSATPPPLIQDFCSRFRYKFLAIGRLSHEKGFDILLRAFATMTMPFEEAGLAIIGEGKRRSALETLATQLGVADRVIFPGYIKNMAAYLCQFDCLVIPSRTEGLPITLLEAMHARIPVIATNVGAVSWVLDAGRCGIIVQPNNIAELANGLESITTGNGEAKRMVEEAFLRLAEHYTADIMERKYNNVYVECINSYPSQ